MCPESSCHPWRAHIEAGFWQELQPVERSPCRSPFSVWNWGWWGIQAGVVCSWRAVLHGKGRSWSSWWRIVFYQGPTLEKGKSLRRKEWQWGSSVNWLQPPLPIPRCSTQRGGSRGVDSEVERGKKVGWGKDGFSFVFVSQYPTRFLIGNKLN